MQSEGTRDVPEITHGFGGLCGSGYNIAMALRKAIPEASTLVVWEGDDAMRDKFLEEARRYGPVEAVETPRDLAERSTIIITSLPNGSAVLKTFIESVDGLLSALLPSMGTTRLFIDTSTIEVSTSLALHENVQYSGHGHLLDAPVSRDATGTLTFTVGGTKSALNQARPVLEMMGKHVIHCGDAGSGLATKLIKSYVEHCKYIAMCEGLNAGIKFGVDRKVLGETLALHGGEDVGNSGGNVPTRLTARQELEMAIELMEEVGAKHVLCQVMSGADRQGKEGGSVWRVSAGDDG